jgi:hypothetical protein
VRTMRFALIMYTLQLLIAAPSGIREAHEFRAHAIGNAWVHVNETSFSGPRKPSRSVTRVYDGTRRPVKCILAGVIPNGVEPTCAMASLGCALELNALATGNGPRRSSSAGAPEPRTSTAVNFALQRSHAHTY